jgi:hypothetical protein
VYQCDYAFLISHENDKVYRQTDRVEYRFSVFMECPFERFHCIG